MSPAPSPTVEAYAGSSYPERPLRVFWRRRWRDIAQIEHQERHPDRRCFIVRLVASRRTRDDTRLRLCYDYAHDAWSAEPLPSHPPEATAK